MFRAKIFAFISFLVLGLSSPSQAAYLTLFFDDFESGLSQWVGKEGEVHHGQIVTDPLDSENMVLNFTALNGRGDIFSSNSFLSASGSYRLSFDYLGIAQAGSVPDNLGGFAGYSFGLPGAHFWLGGTSDASNAIPALEDDGVWHSYSFNFATMNSLRVMLEDFGGSLGVAGDAYFDNVRLETIEVSTESVPEPRNFLSLLSLGVICGAGRLWKKK
ncbi:MAG: hypothetical protein F6K24_08560 [Okeania sp. SIO2D1]|nr:hypothetical protein [Okeania sp. SIO2D1]